LAQQNRGRILSEIDYLHAKAKEAHAVRCNAGLRRLDHLAASLWPDGKPQERMINFSSFWNRYGEAFLHTLLEAPFNRAGGHYLIYI
jgi:uncharacterized protein YllA (UPF0747 family)